MNYIEVIFYLLFIIVTALGWLTNSCSQRIPQPLVAFCHFGRAIKDLQQSYFVKLIQVPKSWFAHFYVYAVAVQAYVLCSTISLVFNRGNSSSRESNVVLRGLRSLKAGDSPGTPTVITLLVSVMFFCHLGRRLYETCFVSVFSGTKMNIAHYLVAFFHYTGSALGIVAHSYCYAVDETSYDRQCNRINLSDLGTWQCIGFIMFLYGSWEQNRTHRYYGQLRKGKDNHVVSLQHKIPSGGLFDKVSCPNYWGEILIYISLGFMFHYKNPTWNAILLWVIGNQVTAGIMNHNWYKRTFPNYPINRKAVIPYLL